MRSNVYLIVVVLLLTGLTASMVLVNTQPAKAQSIRLFAGYAYWSYEGPPGLYGVKGDIYTIDKSVSGLNFYAQFVYVVLNYYPYLHWVGVGYTKGWDTDYDLRFYVEKNDTNGWYLNITDFYPAASSWYTYWVWKPATEWIAGVANQFNHNFGQLSPNDVVDVQAMSETTTDSINIDGTHFKQLKVNAEFIGWMLWATHVLVEDPPYQVDEISDYEFKASGGGQPPPPPPCLPCHFGGSEG